MKNWMTITEISHAAGIPDSTCRRYLRDFSEFFLLQGGSRQKRYEAQAIPVLKRIKQLFDDGLGQNEISKVISQEFPVVVTVDEEQDENSSPSVTTLPTIHEMENLIEEYIQPLKAQLKQHEIFNHKLLEELQKRDEYMVTKFEEVINALNEKNQQLSLQLQQQAEQQKLFQTTEQTKTEQLIKESVKEAVTEIQSSRDQELQQYRQELQQTKQMVAADGEKRWWQFWR